MQMQQEHDHYRLPHQGMWFVLMLLTMLLLWTKNASSAVQCVIA